MQTHNLRLQLRVTQRIYVFYIVKDKISGRKYHRVETVNYHGIFQFQPELLRLILHKSTYPIYIYRHETNQNLRAGEIRKRGERVYIMKRGAIKPRIAMNFKSAKISSVAYFRDYPVALPSYAS